MKELAPIVLFTYNRLLETQQTIEALQKNNLSPDSKLFVFSDGAKDESSKIKVQEVRSYIKTIAGFKSLEIIESPINKGLANSIISGVSRILETHESVIVLEDDLITTRNFLDFMNFSLEYYKDNSKVYAINGYSLNLNIKGDYTHYFHHRAFPWGWATWKDKWQDVNFDKLDIKKYLLENTETLKKFKRFNGADSADMLISSINNINNSWYIRWVFDNFLKDRVSVFPISSKVINIGFSENATHCEGISAYNSITDKDYSRKFNFNGEILLKNNDKRFLKYFSIRYKLLFRLKLIFRSGGLNLIFKEIKNKI